MFEVVQAQLAELSEIAELVNSAYRGESSRAGWTTEADLIEGQRTDPDTLAKELGDGNDCKILCLREAGAPSILACVFLQRYEDEKGVGCYLGMLTVRPGLQASGVGKYLLQQAEEFAARQWQAERMLLGVIWVRESLMAWYERRGYVKNGKTEPFPYDDPKAGRPLRDDLHFIMFEKPLSKR